jgi:hypothetical protein
LRRPQFAPRQRLSADERQREIVVAALALARAPSPDAITARANADRMGIAEGRASGTFQVGTRAGLLERHNIRDHLKCFLRFSRPFERDLFEPRDKKCH